MTKIEKQLEQARADLDAVNDVLTALDASKAKASKTSAEFTEWRASIDKKAGERERLSVLIAALETEIEQAKRDAARAALHVSSRRAEEANCRTGSPDHLRRR